MKRRLRHALAVLPALAVLLPLAARPGAAQTPDRAPHALVPGVEVQLQGPEGGGAGGIDETALRYYARIGDVARMEAEIARLKAIDPGWQPPADLFAPQAAPTGVDETPIWRLLSAGRLAEARAAIAEQRRTTPDWTPSENLTAELERAETAARARTASEAGNWQEVVEAAQADPQILQCNRLDTMWRTAEAYAELGRKEAAYDLYRRVMAECPGAGDRRDTLFKAAPYLDQDQLRALADLGATPAQGEAAGSAQGAADGAVAGQDYGAVREGLAELGIGRILERLSDPKATVPAEDLARAEAFVRERRTADAALALGWYHQNRREHEAARAWFARAAEWEPSDRAAEGLVLALAGLGRREEALAMAKPWLSDSPRVARAAESLRRGGGGGAGGRPDPGAQAWAGIRQAVAARDWSRCLALTTGERRAGRATAALVQQSGWCLMELKRTTEAELAFREAETMAAAAGARDAERLADEARYGSMIARLKRDDTAAVLRDLPESGLSAVQQRNIRADAYGELALRAYDEKRYRDTLRLLDARRELVPETRGLTLMRGWSLYNTRRPAEALEIFEELDRRLSTPDTRNAIDVVRLSQYGG